MLGEIHASEMDGYYLIKPALITWAVECFPVPAATPNLVPLDVSLLGLHCYGESLPQGSLPFPSCF